MRGYWSDFKSPEFSSIPADQIAVLPLGATEQHGPHLSLGTDTTLTDAVITAMWDSLPGQAHVLVLPTLKITKSDEHSAFSGTLTLQPETLLAVLSDIAASVAQTGIRRLVYFNGHGGNAPVLEIAARAARLRHEMVTASTSWFAFADTQTDFDPHDLLHDLHAGAIETSAMLAVAPQAVNMNAAKDFTTVLADWEARSHQTGLTGQPARPGWRIEDLNPDGACGNATAATRQKGAHLVATAAQGFASWLEDFATFDVTGVRP